MSQKYSESAEEAAQIARQTIPFVSKHNLAANPVNYAVFYEYFSGTNTPLRDAADAVVSQRGNLNQELVSDLYFRYVAKEDPAFVAKIQSELRGLVKSMVEAVGIAGTEYEIYETRLREGLGSLDDQATGGHLHELIRGLIDDTHLVVKSNAQLNLQLQTAKDDLGALQQQLEDQRSVSLTDPLTGLANRRAFDAFLANATQQAATTTQPACLIMVDIDHFKAVNDTHGHLIGDQVLRYVAGMLRESVRGEDLTARYGGEEFAVVLVDTPLEGAKHVAEKIRSRIADRSLKHASSGVSIGNVTVSLGLTRHKMDESPEQMIERADRGLYAAKQKGRNRVIVMPEA